MKNKVSVIIPVFNAFNYLENTLNSVLTQSYKKFELIFVNDGSEDGSLDLLHKFEHRDKRIKIFNQLNKGVTAARKLGWQNATGEYITFLDADDFFLENTLEVLMSHAKSENYDIVNASFVSTSGGRIWKHKKIGNLDKNDYLRSLIFGETYGVLYASLYKKEIFLDSTFDFNRSFKIGEDVLMNIELCKRVFKIKNINEIVYQYTDNNINSAMNIIVRHPNYYERYFEKRNNLIREIDENTFYDIFFRLRKIDNSTIINAFFSPIISFDYLLYLKLRKLKNEAFISNFYMLVLSNVYLTIIFKRMKQLLFYFKIKILIRKEINKKIIY